MEEEELKNVDEIKKSIFGSIEGYAPRPVKASSYKTGEEIDNLKAQNKAYFKEIDSLEQKVKKLFKENNRLREYVAELEGKMHVSPKEPASTEWRKKLGLD